MIATAAIEDSERRLETVGDVMGKLGRIAWMREAPTV